MNTANHGIYLTLTHSDLHVPIDITMILRTFFTMVSVTQAHHHVVVVCRKLVYEQKMMQ